MDDDACSVTTIEDQEFDAILEAIRDHLEQTELALSNAITQYDELNAAKLSALASGSGTQSLTQPHDNTPRLTQNLLDKQQRQHQDATRAGLSKEVILSLPPHVLEAALKQITDSHNPSLGDTQSTTMRRRIDHRNEAFMRVLRERQQQQRQEQQERQQQQKSQYKDTMRYRGDTSAVLSNVKLPSEEKADEILSRREELVHDAREAYAQALKAKVARQRREQKQREELAKEQEEQSKVALLKAALEPRKHTVTAPADDAAAKAYVQQLPKSKLYLDLQVQHGSKKRADRLLHAGRRASLEYVSKVNPPHGRRSPAKNDVASESPVNSWALTAVEEQAEDRAQKRNLRVTIGPVSHRESHVKPSRPVAKGTERSRAKVSHHQPAASILKNEEAASSTIDDADYETLNEWRQRPDLKVMRTIFGEDTDTEQREHNLQQQREKDLERKLVKRAQRRKKLKAKILLMAQEAIHHLDQQDKWSQELLIAEFNERLKQQYKKERTNSAEHRRLTRSHVAEDASLSLMNSVVDQRMAQPRHQLTRRSTFELLAAKPVPVEVGRRSLTDPTQDMPTFPELQSNTAVHAPPSKAAEMQEEHTSSTQTQQLHASSRGTNSDPAAPRQAAVQTTATNPQRASSLRRAKSGSRQHDEQDDFIYDHNASIGSNLQHVGTTV
eukprot:m.74308 g.74308  ORF g.74308 m.74308 type:complete len:669 (-) comp13934_c0_seq1:49-2055(-)